MAFGATYKEWRLVLANTRTKLPIDDDTGACYVLTAGSPVEVSLYADQAGTAAANPLTLSNGVIRFFTAASVTSVDLSILTANGDALFLQDVTQSMGRVDVDPDKQNQLLVVPFAASDNTATDTGFDLPVNMLIVEALMRVVTVDSGETIDFGFDNATESGDLDGLIAAASVANAGYVELKPQITGGANIDYVGTNYVGALLATSIAGADAVATVGGFTPKSYRTDGTIKSLVYTGSAGSDTAAGYFVVRYIKLP
jgi:hypothetical protein